jgi:hypothetical protein
MNTKKNFKELLEDFYSNKKQKDYYTANRVMEITGISERTFRYRIKELSELYKDVPSLIHKKDRKWRIHYSIVDEFLSKYPPRSFTFYNLNWKSFITWNCKEKYDEAYHQKLIDEVKNKYPHGNFFSAVEKTKNGVNHVHMVSDIMPNEVKNGVDSVLSNYINQNMYILEVTPVIKKSQAINYLKK